MGRLRDSQKQKVYDWEDACFKENLIPRHRTDLTLKQAEILVHLCRARFGKFSNHPLVKHTRTDSHKSYYQWGWGRGKFIALQPSWGMCENVIIHEVCHELSSCSHHSYFVKVKIELMGFVCGADRVGMRQLATKMRVKWRNRIAIKPQSNYSIQIASLRRKYRRSFNGDFMSDKWLMRNDT